MRKIQKIWHKNEREKLYEKDNFDKGKKKKKVKKYNFKWIERRNENYNSSCSFILFLYLNFSVYNLRMSFWYIQAYFLLTR